MFCEGNYKTNYDRRFQEKAGSSLLVPGKTGIIAEKLLLGAVDLYLKARCELALLAQALTVDSSGLLLLTSSMLINWSSRSMRVASSSPSLAR